jgi:transposase InsO family protein
LSNDTIPVEKEVGELTSEADIRYSLGRARRPKKQSLGERFRKGVNEDDFQNGDGRNLEKDFSDIDDED